MQYVQASDPQLVAAYAAPPGEGQVAYEYAPAPVQYTQPGVFNISPERFAQIAAGIPLTQEEIDAMTCVPVMQESPAAPKSAVVEPAAADAHVGSEKALVASAEKVGSKKRGLKKSKKKSKGCC